MAPPPACQALFWSFQVSEPGSPGAGITYLRHASLPELTQILRNLISNALKFTEVGEVHVTASHDDDSGRVFFRVRDSGIGIAPEDHARIFEEFGQLDTSMHRRVKGTGLGLPLSLSLARLLGG